MPPLTLETEPLFVFLLFSVFHHLSNERVLDQLQCTTWCCTIRGIRRDVEQCCVTKSNKVWGCAEHCGTLRGAACFVWLLVGAKAVGGLLGNAESLQELLVGPDKLSSHILGPLAHHVPMIVLRW